MSDRTGAPQEANPISAGTMTLWPHPENHHRTSMTKNGNIGYRAF